MSINLTHFKSDPPQNRRVEGIFKCPLTWGLLFAHQLITIVVKRYEIYAVQVTHIETHMLTLSGGYKTSFFQNLHIWNAVDVIQWAKCRSTIVSMEYFTLCEKEVLFFEERCCTRLVPKLERLLLQAACITFAWHGAGGETD